MATYSPRSLYAHLFLASRHHAQSHVGDTAAKCWCLTAGAFSSQASPLPAAGIHMQQTPAIAHSAATLHCTPAFTAVQNPSEQHYPHYNSLQKFIYCATCAMQVLTIGIFCLSYL